MTPARVSAASLPRCSAAPTTIALGKLRRSPGIDEREHLEDDAGREPLGPLERPDVAEAHELREHAGHPAQQDRRAALVDQAAADDEQRDPEHAGMPGHVDGDAEYGFRHHAERRDQRDQQQVAERERPDVDGPGGPAPRGLSGHRS